MQAHELLVRTTIVMKAKQLASGLLEKLKARIVARGDMEKRRMRKRDRQRTEALETQKSMNLKAQHHHQWLHLSRVQE